MDGFTHAKQKSTRRRLNPTIRWSNSQTQELLEHVLEEVGIHPGRFEKPTAQIFYVKICSKASIALKFIKWQIIKNKMRNLKTSFLATAAWKAKEGAKLLTEGRECLYNDHINRVCPYYDLLERLYGHLVQPNSSAYIVTTSSDIDEYADEMLTQEMFSSELDTISSNHTQREVPMENVEIKMEQNEPDIVGASYNDSIRRPEAMEDFNAEHHHLEYTPDPSTASNSESDIQCRKRGLSERLPRKKPSDTSSVSQLVAVQEKKLKFEALKLQQQLELERQKLDLEREKLCLAREKNTMDMEMKRMQMEQELELKKFEMERDERIALAKLKLEVESQERIKKYELDLKANRI